MLNHCRSTITTKWISIFLSSSYSFLNDVNFSTTKNYIKSFRMLNQMITSKCYILILSKSTNNRIVTNKDDITLTFNITTIFLSNHSFNWFIKSNSNSIISFTLSNINVTYYQILDYIVSLNCHQLANNFLCIHNLND